MLVFQISRNRKTVRSYELATASNIYPMKHTNALYNYSSYRILVKVHLSYLDDNLDYTETDDRQLHRCILWIDPQIKFIIQVQSPSIISH